MPGEAVRAALARLARGDLSQPHGEDGDAAELIDPVRARWLEERRATLAEVVAAIGQSEQLYRLEQEQRRALEETHRELQHTQERMIASSKLAALGTLAAGVAHEMNQPLTVILSLVDLLRENPRDRIEAHLESIDMVLDATQRLGSIVDNVRTFGRRDTLTLAPMSARVPVDRALALLRERLRLDSIELELVDELEHEVRIRADGNRLQQVFINLLSNARDALVDGVVTGRAPRIRVLLRQDEKDVVLGVSDNGPGIPPELADRIFDPFFTTKEPGRGTGLGLSVSRAIVEEHGGTLTCQQSTAGVSFWCRLPLDPGVGPAQRPAGP